MSAPRSTVPPPVEASPTWTPPSLSPCDQGLEALRYLSTQCAARPLIHRLVESDVQRWAKMSQDDRRAAFERALRRAGAVAPWAVEKGRVADAAALGL